MSTPFSKNFSTKKRRKTAPYPSTAPCRCSAIPAYHARTTRLHVLTATRGAYIQNCSRWPDRYRKQPGHAFQMHVLQKRLPIWGKGILEKFCQLSLSTSEYRRTAITQNDYSRDVLNLIEVRNHWFLICVNHFHGYVPLPSLCLHRRQCFCTGQSARHLEKHYSHDSPSIISDNTPGLHKCNNSIPCIQRV